MNADDWVDQPYNAHISGSGGLEQAGANILIGQDFDAACIRTMTENGYRGLAGDIRGLEAADLLALTGLKKGENGYY